MAVEPTYHALPCGRDPLEIIDASRMGHRDPHTDECPYCQELIVADVAGAEFSLSLRDEEILVPDTLLPSVMSTVWSELRPGKSIPIPAVHGSAFVSEQAVNSTLQNLLDLLPDFQVLTCSIEYFENSGNEPDSPEPIVGPSLDVRVQAAAAYSADLPALADLARNRTSEILSGHFGLASGSIDIDFADIYEQHQELP